MLNNLWKTAGDIAKYIKKKEDKTIQQDMDNLKALNQVDESEIITAMASIPAPTIKP